MRYLVRVLLGLLGLGGALVCAAFLLVPEKVGAALGLVGQGTLGAGTLRGDMSAFFGLGSACLLLASVRGKAETLVIPLVLFATAFVGRTISLATHGFAPQIVQPMAVEATAVLVIGLGLWVLRPKSLTR